MAIQEELEQTSLIKKHRAIINCENSLPLVSRKIFNILLFLVKDQLGVIIEHQVKEVDVIKLLRQSEKDVTNIRANYKKLASTIIEYNILDAHKDHLNGVGTLLSPAVINTTKKTWIFAFPPNVVRWILEPNSFVFLDIAVQQQFNSKYSQALWEICIGSLNDSNETYFSVTLDECVTLMCGNESKLAYKDFKRRVLHVAINEINAKTIIDVNLHHEIKLGRKVNELVFFVKKTGVISTTKIIKPLDQGNELLQTMVGKYGITPKVAEEMLLSFDNEHIERNLAYTEKRYIKATKNDKGHEFNIGAYAVSAIRNGYAPNEPNLPKEIANKAEKKKKIEVLKQLEQQQENDIKLTKLKKSFSELDIEIQDKLKTEFQRKGLIGPVKKIFNQQGWSSEQVNHQFYIFLLVQLENKKTSEGYGKLSSLFN